MGILTGYRVLDCSIAMAGPFAAQRLGDLGAEVIKIEPTTGEWQRHVSAGGAKGNQINTNCYIEISLSNINLSAKPNDEK
jgi:crotonobetainyl-CoA:carnitine CoA-transferase CaiB-like acyl-CoA transferase